MIKLLNAHAERVLSRCSKSRLLALDVLRGMTITAMVLVNNPGSWANIYAPLKHAHWHGLTPTDLVFPFFVFMMGISIGLVINRAKTQPLQHLKVWTRTLKLFGLGLFLFLFYINFQSETFSWVEDRLYKIRFFGVLQRLAIVYVIAYYIAFYVSSKTQKYILVSILSGYWAISAFVPYQDSVGNTYMGELAYGNSLAAWLDNLILGSQHLYYKTAQPFAFDPEGVLSTVPTVASALTGVFAANILTNQSLQTADKAKQLLIYGIAMLLIGYLISLVVPINKQLWTSSFVLVSSGWASAILAGLIWLLDIKGYKKWSAPFVVFGVNAIGFFVFSGLFARALLMIPVGETSLKGMLYRDYFSQIISPTFGSLVFALCFCAACYLVFYKLYQKQIIFKV
ncbi:DUF5009 domain-containing protein [Paraglaciecola aquimarina]|uniref:DUF5009 domain-containing protein n=1 Tax=Paraglaciecola algarum TaxID=3050085 RepID=A0ABS9D4W0_9ALTE|nr:DUF5009 domain-containing protein [Paraglaciecola sp. G1-23]MCF2947800.1 DUF5009 domain-containing protein [Paraglaciecola sp. G1-23]